MNDTIEYTVTYEVLAGGLDSPIIERGTVTVYAEDEVGAENATLEHVVNSGLVLMDITETN